MLPSAFRERELYAALRRKYSDLVAALQPPPLPVAHTQQQQSEEQQKAKAEGAAALGMAEKLEVNGHGLEPKVEPSAMEDDGQAGQQQATEAGGTAGTEGAAAAAVVVAPKQEPEDAVGAQAAPGPVVALASGTGQDGGVEAAPTAAVLIKDEGAGGRDVNMAEAANGTAAGPAEAMVKEEKVEEQGGTCGAADIKAEAVTTEQRQGQEAEQGPAADAVVPAVAELAGGPAMPRNSLWRRLQQQQGQGQQGPGEGAGAVVLAPELPPLDVVQVWHG